jgi:hypothetical protein
LRRVLHAATVMPSFFNCSCTLPLPARWPAPTASTRCRACPAAP